MTTSGGSPSGRTPRAIRPPQSTIAPMAKATGWRCRSKAVGPPQRKLGPSTGDLRAGRRDIPVRHVPEVESVLRPMLEVAQRRLRQRDIGSDVQLLDVVLLCEGALKRTDDYNALVVGERLRRHLIALV